MKIHCHSNLDLRGEVWPDALEFRPMVGDLIRSRTERGRRRFRLELQVCRITIVQPSDREIMDYVNGNRQIPQRRLFRR